MEKLKVFQMCDGRVYRSFPKFQCNMMLRNLSLENINEWMTQQMENLITYGCIKKKEQYKFNVQWKSALNNLD